MGGDRSKRHHTRATLGRRVITTTCTRTRAAGSHMLGRIIGSTTLHSVATQNYTAVLFRDLVLGNLVLTEPLQSPFEVATSGLG